MHAFVNFSMGFGILRNFACVIPKSPSNRLYFICYGYISHLASFEPKWWTYPIQALYLPIAGALGFVISLVMTIFYLVAAHKARGLAREE